MNIIPRVPHKYVCVQRHFSAYSPESLLKQENVVKTLSKFRAMPSIRMQTHEPPRKAAVLIPICVIDGKVSLLYTLRAANLRSHKGQVSFPGGMQDDMDKTLHDTAVRETKEELGIEANDIKVWGSGNTIIANSDISVVPVIGFLNKNIDIANLKVNTAEVEEVFTVPIQELCRCDKMGFTQFRVGYSTPIFFGGKRRIWGLTAIITNIFLKCLIDSSSYKDKIKFVQPVKVTKKLTAQ